MTQKTLQVVGPEWFQQQSDVQTVQLPSQQGTDKAVLLRRPDLVDLIATSGAGDVPDVLTNLVLSMLNKKDGGKKGDKQTLEITEKTLPQVMQSLNHVAAAAFVSPKVWTRDTAEGEYIPASWIPFGDRAFVFAWAMGGQYQATESFPASANAGVDAVSQVRDLPPSSK